MEKYCENGRTWVRRVEGVIPTQLIRIFPELGDDRFFIAKPGERGHGLFGQKTGVFYPKPFYGKWICEPDGDRVRRWEITSPEELSSNQIIALLELRPELDKGSYGYAEDLKIQGVEFGSRVSWFEEAAVKELVHRSLVNFRNHPATQATAWLAENFDKNSYVFVEWLRRVIDYGGLDKLCEKFPHSKAVKFAETEPVTGEPEQWGFLPAIPADRKEVRLSYSGDRFFLPNGETVPAQKISGGGYFRVREDGRTDLFLKRGSRELGDCGWLWVVINPQESIFEVIERAIDPLDNYYALGEPYTPLFYRIARAHARAHGWNLKERGYYSSVVEAGIYGPKGEARTT
jgi:hypothetical protein